MPPNQLFSRYLKKGRTVMTVKELLKKMDGKYFDYEIYNNSGYSKEMPRDESGEYIEELLDREVSHYMLADEESYYHYTKRKRERMPFAEIVGVDNYHGEEILMISVMLTFEEKIGNLFNALNEDKPIITGINPEVLEKVKRMTGKAKEIENEMPQFSVRNIDPIKAGDGMWKLEMSIDFSGRLHIASVSDGTIPKLTYLSELIADSDTVIFSNKEPNRLIIKFCVCGLFDERYEEE